MTGRPIALHLANELERSYGHALALNAAAELRRLHAANVDCMDHFNALMEERNELLAVLKELLDNPAGDYSTTDDYEIASKKAHALIAKATGAA